MKIKVLLKKLGSNVTEIKVGDRIAFADVPFSNAEYVVVPKDKIIPLPNEISFETAAGGVSQLLVQIVKLLDGKVIGLTSSLQKSRNSKKCRSRLRIFI